MLQIFFGYLCHEVLLNNCANVSDILQPISTVKKINLIQTGYLEFRTNLRFFRIIILVFRTISQFLNYKTEFGPGLEQFQQIRTILRFLDPI